MKRDTRYQYEPSFLIWQGLNDETVENIMQSDNPVDDFKADCLGRYYDARSDLERKEIVQSRVPTQQDIKEVQRLKRHVKTLKAILGIAEDISDMSDVYKDLREKEEEIMELWDGRKWNRNDVRDAMYELRVYKRRAIAIDHEEKIARRERTR